MSKSRIQRSQNGLSECASAFASYRCSYDRYPPLLRARSPRRVRVRNSHVQTGKGSSGSSVSIANGAVTIDGELVPADAREFTSRKGNHFRIDRHGSSVEVHQD